MDDHPDDSNRSGSATSNNRRYRIFAHSVFRLIPWWAWLGLAIVFGIIALASVLQLSIILDLNSREHILHLQICKIAVVDHTVIAGCKS
jgi:hypothetical protein